MAHKNYGGIAHTNTGYNNHTQYNNYSQSGGYSQSGYSNGYTQNYADYHQAYHNHTNYYNQGSFYHEHTHSQYLAYNDIGCRDRKQVLKTVFTPQPRHGQSVATHGNYNNYVQHDKTADSGSSGYRQNNHRNYSQAEHAQYRNAYSQSGYANNYYQAIADYHQAYHNHTNYYNHTNTGGYSTTGYNNHGNTGYTNHVNTTTNVAPGNVANVSRGSSAYYKSTISLTWTAATDNNKVISVVSRNTGSGGHADNGIWENTVLKQGAARSWCAAAWNSNGSYVGSIASDVYGNAANATTFINWLNANATSGRYVAVLGFDEPYTNASAIINALKGWGFSSLSAADTSHFVFTGIAHMGVGIKAQQTVRRYGTSDVRVASSSYTIPGVASSQAITYYIDYAFKPIGGSYGSWTRIVNGHTTNSYNYSLASHGNGHIKFRVLSSDGVENGSTWVESSEVRVLKYDAPAFSTTASGNTIDDADGELVRVEINKLCVATGQAQATTAITPAKVMTQAELTDMRNKIKSVGTAISKTNITDTNLDIVRPADLQNIKNWIKTV